MHFNKTPISAFSLILYELLLVGKARSPDTFVAADTALVQKFRRLSHLGHEMGNQGH